MNHADPRPPVTVTSSPRARQYSGSKSVSWASSARLPRLSGSASMAPMAVAMRRPPFVNIMSSDDSTLQSAAATAVPAASLGYWRCLSRRGGASCLPIGVAANQVHLDHRQTRSQADDCDSPGNRVYHLRQKRNSRGTVAAARRLARAALRPAARHAIVVSRKPGLELGVRPDQARLRPRAFARAAVGVHQSKYLARGPRTCARFVHRVL